jgi:hypothetical protein
MVYIWLTRLIALGVVLQAAFVAWGTFDIFNAAEDGRAFTEDTERYAGQALHSTVGMMVFPLLALLLLIAAFFAKTPRGVGLAGIVLGLVVLQIVLGFVSYPAPVVGTLHAINAFALAAVAGFAGSRAGKSAATETPAPA